MMDNFLQYFKTETIIGIPLSTLSAALVVIILSLLLKKVFSHLVIKYIKSWTEKTTTQLDELLLHAVEGPLQLIIIGIGFYIARIILTEYLILIEKLLTQSFQLFFIIVICFFLYRGTGLIIFYLEKIAKRTRTELDDLLLPYLSKLVRIILVLIVVIKFSEIFLGKSAAALLGLFGGVGLTLGLVFKDIIANWFGCGIIYLDKLFNEGDWVSLDDGKIIDADVEEIGLRSTKFRNFDKTVSIVPNATIASAVVKNWSRMYKRRVKYNFIIDGIHAETMEKLLQGIRDILSQDEDVHQEFHMVNFRELEGNSRIIRLYYFTKTIKWKEHEQVRENINIKILKRFEELGIDHLSYTIVDLSEDRPGDYLLTKQTE
jgi:MscS family membrane protein